MLYGAQIEVFFSHNGLVTNLKGGKYPGGSRVSCLISALYSFMGLKNLDMIQS